MPTAATVLDCLHAALRDDPGRPLVTYYDDATGERVELSTTTTDNWVSKIANFADDVGLLPGEEFSVRLPLHWQLSVVLLGCWTAGLVLRTDQDAGVGLAVVGPDSVEVPGLGAGGSVLACSLRPLGGRFTTELPAGWHDFALEIPPQPDALVGGGAPGPDDAALRSADGVDVSHADLLAHARESAARVGLVPGSRLVTDRRPTDTAALLDVLVAPLAAGASVVLMSPTTPERRTAIMTQERATHESWQQDVPRGAAR